MRSRYPDLYRNMPRRFKGTFLVIPVVGIVLSGYLLILQGWKPLLFAVVWMAVGAIVYTVSMRPGGRRSTS
ncbi:MAG: hypothetical protein ACOC8N_08320 [Spirochaetota bacterium]